MHLAVICVCCYKYSDWVLYDIFVQDVESMVRIFTMRDKRKHTCCWMISFSFEGQSQWYDIATSHRSEIWLRFDFFKPCVNVFTKKGFLLSRNLCWASLFLTSALLCDLHGGATSVCLWHCFVRSKGNCRMDLHRLIFVTATKCVAIDNLIRAS